MSQKKKKQQHTTRRRLRRQKQTSSHQAASSRAFFGQTVPGASKGAGRQVLYRCTVCQQVWFQDGAQVRLRLAPEEIAEHAMRLSADLSRLPEATCRLCLFQVGTGVFEIDEYGAGTIGYGINWEAAAPLGAHTQATIVSESRMQAQMLPDVVRHPERARAVLSWLQQARLLPCVHVLTEQEAAQIALDNPPGHGMTGTEKWQWKGAFFRLPCPPLGDTALVLLVVAQPPVQPLDIVGLVSLWQELAALALQGHFSGEQD